MRFLLLVQQIGPPGTSSHGSLSNQVALNSVFLFFIYLKKPKIYVRFEKFRKYPPVARPRGDRGPVAQATGDRTLM